MRLASNQFAVHLDHFEACRFLLHRLLLRAHRALAALRQIYADDCFSSATTLTDAWPKVLRNGIELLGQTDALPEQSQPWMRRVPPALEKDPGFINRSLGHSGFGTC